MWSGTDVKKVAEVYEFYAAYKSAQNKTISANSYTFRIVYTQEMMMDIINIIQTHPEILIMGGI